MKENIGKLVKAICKHETDAGEVEFLTDFVAEKLSHFTNYFNAVYKDVVSAEINLQLRNSGRIDQEQFAFRREKTYSARRSAHDVAINSCKILNRLCDQYGVEHICPESEERHVIADFVGSFVYNIYQEGVGQMSLDQVFELAKAAGGNPDKRFDTTKVKEVVKNAHADFVQGA